MPPTIRGFLSYSNKDRRIAAEVRKAIAVWGVDAFMAHEDITVSEEWRARILAELKGMEVFVPILSEAFRQSSWTAQEAGAAVVRNVLIIPVSIDQTVPFGFLGQWQGHLLRQPIDPIVFRDVLLDQFPRAVIGAMIERVGSAWSYRNAEALFEPLVPLFNQFTKEEAQLLADKAAENNQIWNASLCRASYLPAFLDATKGKLRLEQRNRLKERLRG